MSLFAAMSRFMAARDEVLEAVPPCVPDELRANVHAALLDVETVLLRAVRQEELHNVESFHAEVDRRLGRAND